MPTIEHISTSAARITIWYVSLPDPKPPYFTCQMLTTGTGLSMRRISSVLIGVLGWSRAEVWIRRNNRRIKRVLYNPPGFSIPRPPRGRPRFNLEDYLTIRIL